jgi:hypothetical protein
MPIITIKRGRDIELKVPRFICDNILKKDVPPPFDLLVDSYKCILYVGIPRAGKTSHMISLFKDKRLLRKCWDNVIIVCPQESLNSLRESDNIFKDIDPSKKYDSIESIDVIREQVKFFASQGENSVIIIDDQMSRLKNPVIEKILLDIVSNRRHYRCSIIILSQIYERVPKRVRKLINVCIMMFKPSIADLNMMMTELVEQDEETAREVSKIAFKKKFDFLLVDAPSQRVFANYNELVFSDE